MPLTFHPGPGAIVICDFRTGFRPPEIVKERPVVIISPKRRRERLATVVPLSNSEPAVLQPWHYLVPDGVYPPARAPMWAKADLVMTVALDRLDRVRVRDESGNRTYRIFQMTDAQLAAVRDAVLAALGLR